MIVSLHSKFWLYLRISIATFAAGLSVLRGHAMSSTRCAWLVTCKSRPGEGISRVVKAQAVTPIQLRGMQQDVLQERAAAAQYVNNFAHNAPSCTNDMSSLDSHHGDAQGKRTLANAVAEAQLAARRLLQERRAQSVSVSRAQAAVILKNEAIHAQPKRDVISEAVAASYGPASMCKFDGEDIDIAARRARQVRAGCVLQSVVARIVATKHGNVQYKTSAVNG